MNWHTVTVVPCLPEKLKPLERLARNLWYTWHPDVIELWRRLDRDQWEKCHHNPVCVLSRMSQQQLEEAEKNESFLLHMDRVMEEFLTASIHGCGRWCWDIIWCFGCGADEHLERDNSIIGGQRERNTHS